MVKIAVHYRHCQSTATPTARANNNLHDMRQILYDTASKTMVNRAGLSTLNSWWGEDLSPSMDKGWMGG